MREKNRGIKVGERVADENKKKERWGVAGIDAKEVEEGNKEVKKEIRREGFMDAKGNGGMVRYRCKDGVL